MDNSESHKELLSSRRNAADAIACRAELAVSTAMQAYGNASYRLGANAVLEDLKLFASAGARRAGLRLEILSWIEQYERRSVDPGGE